MSRHKIKLKNLVSYIMAVFIALSICLCFISVILKGGLFNDTTLKKCLNESTYYEEKSKLLNSRLKDRVNAAGLPDSVANDVITDRMVTLHANKIINDGIAGKHSTPDTSALEEKLSLNISQYLKDNNIEENKQLKDAENVLIKEVSGEYATQMTFNFVNIFRMYNDKYLNAINIIIIVSVIICVICTMISVLIHRRKYRGLRYSGYGILAGSVLSGIVSLLIKGKILSVIPPEGATYYNVIQSYIKQSFNQNIYICLAGVLIFCLITITNGYLKKEAI